MLSSLAVPFRADYAAQGCVVLCRLISFDSYVELVLEAPPLC